jgi:hypothetical protein
LPLWVTSAYKEERCPADSQGIFFQRWCLVLSTSVYDCPPPGVGGRGLPFVAVISVRVVLLRYWPETGVTVPGRSFLVDAIIKILCDASADAHTGVSVFYSLSALVSDDNAKRLAIGSPNHFSRLGANGHPIDDFAAFVRLAEHVNLRHCSFLHQ